MIPKYPGDAKIRELLIKYGATVSFEELRAAMAGAIFGIEVVQPSVVLSILKDDEDAPSGLKSEKEAQEFYSAMMSLWNEIAGFQESGAVFRFAPLPQDFDEKDAQAQLFAGERRLSELEYFLDLLEESDARISSTGGEPSSEDHLNFLPLVLDATANILFKHIEQIEKGKTTEAWMIAATIRSMDDKMEKLFPRFMSQVRADRLVRQAMPHEHDDNASDPSSEDPWRHVGRNEPCPCGSGVKYKRCCFQ